METLLKNAIPSTIRLRESDRTALEAHFVSLGPEDRSLRFGAPIRDEGLQAYVAHLDFERDRLFGVQDDDFNLLAVVHVAFTGDSAELGLSVRPGFRGQGLGKALFARAVVHLRNRGATEVFVHCLSENAAMMHLARTHGMRVIPAGAETDARLAIEPATPHSHYLEWMHDYHARAVRTARHNLRFSRAMLGVFFAG